MKTEENISPEVKELLDALAEPQANQKRQLQLSELIDSLASQEKIQTTKRHRVLVWTSIVATAACLFLFIMRMPEGTVEKALPSTPILVSDNKSVEPDTLEATFLQPTSKSVTVIAERPMLFAEVRETEQHADTETLTTIKTAEPVAAEEEVCVVEVLETAPTTPTRRVIACNTLVCYDCKEPRHQKRTKQIEDKTIFGTPSTSNMDGGMLMLASL